MGVTYLVTLAGGRDFVVRLGVYGSYRQKKLESLFGITFLIRFCLLFQ